MTLDENELRKALSARSGEPTTEYRARLQGALASPRPANNWTAIVAALVVTALTATSVGLLVYSRHPLNGGLVASPPRVTSPTPSEIPLPTDVQLSAPSSTVVWALVAYKYLFRSTDQGKTWQQRTTPTFTSGAGATPHISFVDELDGWMFFVVDSPDCSPRQASPARTQAQQGVQVYRTTDGATTWTLIDYAVYGQVSPNGLPLEQCKDAFAFIDPQHGIAGTSDPVSTNVWRTSDAGVTWTATRLPSRPGYVPDGWPRTIVFIQSFGGTLVLYAPLDIFESTDGGATWTYVASYPTPLAFVSPLRWLVIFPASTGETLDAGKTWHDFPTDYHTDSTQMEAFVFADERVGYGTDRGKLLRTIDGGAHWKLIKTSWP